MKKIKKKTAVIPSWERWELFIVTHLAAGYTVKEIAPAMELSCRTVEAYTERIREKYGAVNTAHLVAIFYQQKLLK